GRAEEANLGVAFGPRLLLPDDRDGRHPIDAVLFRFVGLEHEVDLVYRDPVRDQRELVENLARLQAAVAAQGLREEQQADRPLHARKRVTELFLIGGRYQSHAFVEAGGWRLAFFFQPLASSL